ncbi:hypothetical protein ILUMI_14844, partial [Ignelater luminosus]
IGFYAFCFVDVKSSSPHFYTWTENQCGRGSNATGSADACGGQNKDSHICFNGGSDKEKAVNMLLKKRFGEEWIKEEQLNFYFKILKEQITFEEQTDEAEKLCGCLEEESGPIQ